MNHHAGGFVNDQEVIVFVDDIQGYILGDYFPIALWTVQYQSDHLQRLNLVVALYRLSVNADTTGLGSFLNAVTAGVTQMVH